MRFSILLLSCFLSLSGLSQEKFLRLKGEIIDEATGEAIRGCNMSVMRTSGSISDGQTALEWTVKGGKYDFFLSPGPVYKVYFSKNGYYTKFILVDLNDVPNIYSKDKFTLNSKIKLTNRNQLDRATEFEHASARAYFNKRYREVVWDLAYLKDPTRELNDNAEMKPIVNKISFNALEILFDLNVKKDTTFSIQAEVNNTYSIGKLLAQAQFEVAAEKISDANLHFTEVGQLLQLDSLEGLSSFKASRYLSNKTTGNVPFLMGNWFGIFDILDFNELPSENEASFIKTMEELLNLAIVTGWNSEDVSKKDAMVSTFKKVEMFIQNYPLLKGSPMFDKDLTRHFSTLQDELKSLEKILEQ